MPTTRGFWEAKDLGDAGELRAARLLALHGTRLLPDTRLLQIRVKLDDRSPAPSLTWREHDVTIRLEREGRASQIRGDVELDFADAQRRTLEVKTEQYALEGHGAVPRGVRVTGNVAFETHDVVRPADYEDFWAEPGRGERLNHPRAGLTFRAAEASGRYGRIGGHRRTQADWLLHLFAGNGAALLLSLARVRRALAAGHLDTARWYASCTARPGQRAECRRRGDPGIAYYTVGKLLPVRLLMRLHAARLLTETDGAGFRMSR